MAPAPTRATPHPATIASLQRGGTGDRLESWNQIAAYLNRTVRTAHRWEQDEGLPVHRHHHKKLGTVYAYRSELDSWLKGRRRDHFSGSPAQPILAVLPFENLSGDPRQEYFSDGITEEVIAELSRLSPEIGVIARTSVSRYKRTRKSARAIGRKLGARYLLEGSIRQHQQRLRIISRLVQVQDQTCVWTSRFDRDLQDILSIHYDVAHTIAAEIKLKLCHTRNLGARSPATGGRFAREAHLRGRYFWSVRSRTGIQRAIQFLNEAVVAEPDDAAAYADLAGALSMASYYGVMPRGVSFCAAQWCAERALELDGNLVEARAVSAILKEKDFDWSGAERDFAAAVDSGYASAHHWHGLFLERMGRLAEAESAMQRAIRLDPTSSIIRKNFADPYFFGGEYDRAIEIYKDGLRLDPGFAPARLFLGFCYEQKGMLNEAIAEFESIISANQEEPNALAALSHTYALLGRRSAARATLARLRGSVTYLDPYHAAVTQVALGNVDTAFDYLATAFRDRAEWLLYLKIDPRIQRLRRDSRYRELVSRMNLSG